MFGPTRAVATIELMARGTHRAPRATVWPVLTQVSAHELQGWAAPAGREYGTSRSARRSPTTRARR